MAKLTRYTQKIFGSTAGSNQMAEFGSLANGSPARYSGATITPAIVQTLSNYLTGWFGGVIGGNSPAIEDANALNYLFSYQLASIFQDGIPLWDASTTYYLGSVVNNANTATYVSITDNNIGNPISDTSNWRVFCNNTLRNNGDIQYSQDHGVLSQLAANTTTTKKFLTETGTGSAGNAPGWNVITASDLPVLGSGLSSSCGSFSTSSSSAVDVTNLSVTFTTTGHPVVISMIPDGSSTAFVLPPTNTNSAELLFVVDGVTVGQLETVFITGQTARLGITPTIYTTPAAGSHTFKVQAYVATTGTFSIANYKLYAKELY